MVRPLDDLGAPVKMLEAAGRRAHLGRRTNVLKAGSSRQEPARLVARATIASAAFVAAAITKLWIRPWVVASNLPDAGITGWLPSFAYPLGVLVAAGALAVRHAALDRRWNLVSASFVVGALLYEFAQLAIFPARRFDLADVLATLAGGVVGLALDRWLRKPAH